jgi:type I restriction-modification system DNA methylase subunit
LIAERRASSLELPQCVTAEFDSLTPRGPERFQLEKPMSDPNLSSFIWSVADLLRGDYKQSEYGKVILPFTVLRRLDCVLPRVSDGSLLFLLHLISKMRPAKDGGSRFGIVLNGSPLFTGGAGSGESEIRRYVLENDLLEAIIGLPVGHVLQHGHQHVCLDRQQP